MQNATEWRCDHGEGRPPLAGDPGHHRPGGGARAPRPGLSMTSACDVGLSPLAMFAPLLRSEESGSSYSKTTPSLDLL